ncbi:alpha/beta fold hydrolase [Prolixibacter sp. SD074]|uniref:alpha/beta fold hydrolase n=1 Tax=Prolixibacter sp. SD074 TaxID=2652391 RepID=UPI0012994AA2|nr:alpha/beta hydrolase [Prolixibacter sp. SD074]
MKWRNWILTMLIIWPLMAMAQPDKIKPLDAMLTDYRYPYPVSYLDLHIQNQDLKMAYMDVMPANYNHKNIMLLHGKNFNGAYWGQTIKALTAKGYRVIVPDQIGFGKSSKPAHFQYSFQQLASNTKALLDHIGVKHTAVLGHSMGGMLATRFALMYPQVTDKLILENPIGLEDYKLKVPYKSITWWYQNELKKSYASIRKYMLGSYYAGHWKPAYDEWVNILAGWTQSKDYPVVAWNSALTYDMIFTQPVVYEFKNIKCPTLLIIGTRDRTALGKPLVSDSVRATMGLYNKLGKETQAKIPGSKLVEIPGIGHLPHIEAFPKFIRPLENFLRE